MTTSLQAQVNAKAYDVKDVEARLARLATEKAKADNRYFQAMRHKDGLEAECKATHRTVEKQSKALDREREAQAASQAQIVSVTAVRGTAVRESHGPSAEPSRLYLRRVSSPSKMRRQHSRVN